MLKQWKAGGRPRLQRLHVVTVHESQWNALKLNSMYMWKGSAEEIIINQLCRVFKHLSARCFSCVGRRADGRGYQLVFGDKCCVPDNSDLKSFWFPTRRKRTGRHSQSEVLYLSTLTSRGSCCLTSQQRRHVFVKCSDQIEVLKLKVRPISYRKQCSWKASSVAPPLNLWLCDITLTSPCHKLL